MSKWPPNNCGNKPLIFLPFSILAVFLTVYTQTKAQSGNQSLVSKPRAPLITNQCVFVTVPEILLARVGT